MFSGGSEHKFLTHRDDTQGRVWETEKEKQEKCHETSLLAQSKKKIIDFVCNFFHAALLLPLAGLGA